jgi:serine/threonine protein kinase
MEYLHRNKISHRDLKPANILVCYSTISGLYLLTTCKLDKELIPKLADFGLSKVKDLSSKMNTLVGTAVV